MLALAAIGMIAMNVVSISNVIVIVSSNLFFSRSLHFFSSPFWGSGITPDYAVGCVVSTLISI